MMPGECTASEFLQHGYLAASLAQTGIVLRASEYGAGARLWIGFTDRYRAKDHARMAATLAFLAFPDLRERDNDPPQWYQDAVAEVGGAA